jgi:DNA-binding GntR family transcriptional regulator
MLDTARPGDDTVGRLLARLRTMAADFELRPGERVNESALSRDLGASRTPLREALNRLVAEGYLDFRPGKGFFCRPLSPDHILNLYEARTAIEGEALRASLSRATDARIAALSEWLDHTEADYASSTIGEDLLALDEAFHTRLAALAENPELDRLLANINGRIRFVRLIDLKAMLRDGTRDARMSAHRTILAHLAAREADAAQAALRAHIEKRRDQATRAVRAALADIYMPKDPVP